MVNWFLQIGGFWYDMGMKTSKSVADINCAKHVLDLEIKGLQALSNALDEKFVAVVDLVAGLKGRLIVSGMGKSGHIARKMAATFASTGTPSYFVHPSEASHGDLGMIGGEDAVLALSNSGETAELKDLIGYARRFSIPLIGVARRANSMLLDAADIGIALPEIPEASPTGAPTTSTTMMLAFGDALAMALLERKGFTPEDFNVYHPGGKLGKAFIRVEDLMHKGKQLPLAKETDIMSDVLLIMTAKSFGCAAITDNNGLMAGVITDGDLRRHMSSDLVKMVAKDVMTRNPITIRPGALAAEALAVMNGKSITSLFVVEDNKPIGILHVHDCLRAGVM